MSVTINGTNGLTFNDASTQNTAATGFGFKNRIINGAMVIDQRNAGASVSTSSGSTAYTVDRFQTNYTQTSKYTVQQNAGSVTPPTGLTNYLGITSLSAYSVISSDVFYLQQKIEGLNVADLAWGTSSAATITLSFYVRSSLTGTFGGVIANSAFNRTYPFSYSIASANTWTPISVTIPGDTSGTWLTNNGVGLVVVWSLGAGSTYSGTAGAWGSANVIQPTGATSVVGTNGATFYITGVQLEKGSTATSFDYRPYGTELALCQRYYQTGNAVCYVGAKTSANSALIGAYFPVSMRAAPTGAITSTSATLGTNWAIDATYVDHIEFGNTSTGELRQRIVYTVAIEL